MAGICKRPKLTLGLREHLFLQKLAHSRTAPARAVQRAQILWHYHAGESIAEIERRIHASRNTIYKCLDKAATYGIETALHDAYHTPKKPIITDDDKCWVIAIATTRPTAHGYHSPTWTRQLLADHIRKHALKAGHPVLGRASKATIQRILNPTEPPIRRPHHDAYSHFTRPTPRKDKNQMSLPLDPLPA